MTIYDEVTKAIYNNPDNAKQFLKDINLLCDKWKLNRKALRFAISLLG